MKRIVVVFIFFSLGFSSLFSQRFAVVDTKYILENLEDYKTAETTLRKQISAWAGEIKTLEDKHEKNKLVLENKKILLTKELFKEELDKVNQEADSIKALKNKRYGADGDIVKLRVNLVAPIQNKIYNIVRVISEKERYAFVFDKSSDVVLIYSDPKTQYDITEKVLNKLTRK